MTRLLVLLLICAATLFPQTGETDIGEIGGHLGGVFGIGSHPNGGLTFLTAVSRYAFFGAEVAFSPLGEESLRQPGTPFTGIERSRLYDVNGTVHVRIPVRDRWEPYVPLGVGWLRSVYERQTSAGPEASRVKVSADDFAFHLGAGVRYFVTNKFGVRPEFRYYVTDRNFSRLTIGLFCQFP
jgi:opacity protein-like surface antigen